MRQKSLTSPLGAQAEKMHSDVRRTAPKRYAAEDSIAALCRCIAMAERRYAGTFKGFFEAGERRLPGDATSAAIADAVSILDRQALERCLLQGNTIAEGGTLHEHPTRQQAPQEGRA
jgi:hypothetical protein